MAKGKKAQATTSSDVISKFMPIMEIVTLMPEAKNILAEYGLHCFSCAGSEYEALGEGCTGHGFSDEEIDELVDDLNQMLRDMPPRPETLTLTLEGARAIKKIADAEERTDQILEVIADANGGFCMEFQTEPSAGLRPAGKIFTNPNEPSIRVAASPLTLIRIGGATIDFRDGRFKLDLPEDAKTGGCGCSGASCDCKSGSCGC